MNSCQPEMNGVYLRQVLLFEHWMLAGFVTLALGNHHSMILKQDGRVWSTGCNKLGQLGAGAMLRSFNFVWASLSDAKAVACLLYTSDAADE